LCYICLFWPLRLALDWLLALALLDLLEEVEVDRRCMVEYKVILLLFAVVSVLSTSTDDVDVGSRVVDVHDVIDDLHVLSFPSIVGISDMVIAFNELGLGFGCRALILLVALGSVVICLVSLQVYFLVDCFLIE
jgi:hypothetical protein